MRRCVASSPAKDTNVGMNTGDSTQSPLFAWLHIKPVRERIRAAQQRERPARFDEG
jgi:hypothetical protein